MEKIKISIIVPIYNTENYLEECLESLINQTYFNIEIICIDDCSEDGSASILENYAKKDKRIIFRKKEKNEGCIKARNLAYEISSGDFIMQVDSDDFLERTAVEKMVSFILNENLDCCIYDSYRFQGKNFEKVNILKDGSILSGKEAFLMSLDWKIGVLGCYRREFFVDYQENETFFNGDELSGRIRLLSLDRIGVGIGKYFYRQHETSYSHKVNFKSYQQILSDIELKNFLKKNFNEKELIEAVSYTHLTLPTTSRV